MNSGATGAMDTVQARTPAHLQISALADVPQLAAALIPGLLDYWRFILPNDTAESRARRFRAHENRDRLPMAWIAHCDGIALGTAALRATDLPGREDLIPWLGGVYVAPPYRGRGIAAALCRRVEDKARELGHTALHLFTLPQTAGLYARLGWTDPQATHWNGHPCILLRKGLVAEP